MEFQKQGHAVYYPRYHVVIATQYRRKLFKGGLGRYLQAPIVEVTKYYPDIQILEVNPDDDHMHILVSIPPKMAVSRAVNIIKSQTGRAMRPRVPFLDKVYWGTPGMWSIGHFVSTVGVDEEIIRRYIEQQGQEDRGQAKLEF